MQFSWFLFLRKHVAIWSRNLQCHVGGGGDIGVWNLANFKALLKFVMGLACRAYSPILTQSAAMFGGTTHSKVGRQWPVLLSHKSTNHTLITYMLYFGRQVKVAWMAMVPHLQGHHQEHPRRPCREALVLSQFHVRSVIMCFYFSPYFVGISNNN